MGSTKEEIENRNLQELIKEFCEIILTTKDDINSELGVAFIDSLTGMEKSILNSADEEIATSYVRMNIISYIEIYNKSTECSGQLLSSPFEFDSGDNYKNYKKEFELRYREKNEQAALPLVFKKAFDDIKEMSEHYRIFEKFYTIRSQETAERILSKTSNMAKEQAKKAVQIGISESVLKSAEEAASRATMQAELLAKKAASEAEISAEKAEKAAKEAVEQEVKNKMSEVTQKISETSVTILSIFSGIVLTVVAGLFYSSSVIDNINAANFNRLICASALVGFVCFNLIAIMFRFVEKIRSDSKQESLFSDKIVLFVSITLLVIMGIFGIIQFKDTDNSANKSTSSIDVSVDVYESVSGNQ